MEPEIGELRKLAEAEDYPKLRERAKVLHPHDLSEFLQGLEQEQRSQIIVNLDLAVMIDLLPELPEEMQLEYVEILPPMQAAELLAKISPDEMADVLGDLPLDTRKKIVGYFTKEKTKEARDLLKYPEDTAGGLMTTQVVALPGEYTCSEAEGYIREKATEYETVYYIYVVEDGRLVGVLSLRELVLAPPEAKLMESMNPEVIRVQAELDQEEVARLIADYDLLAIPVVNPDDMLLGIVTVDDVIDVIDEEITEDMALLSGTGAGIDKLLEAPALEIVKARLPWLIFALVGDGLIASSVLKTFEETLASAVALALFIPVIMAMGGATGIQSSTIFVRGLAIGEIDKPGRYFLREIKVGVMMGALVAVGIALVAQVLLDTPFLGLIVGVAMFFTMTLATAIGVLIPKLFDRLGLDPAITSNPLISTTQDIIGLFIYFGIATMMLGYMQP